MPGSFRHLRSLSMERSHLVPLASLLCDHACIGDDIQLSPETLSRPQKRRRRAERRAVRDALVHTVKLKSEIGLGDADNTNEDLQVFTLDDRFSVLERNIGPAGCAFMEWVSNIDRLVLKMHSVWFGGWHTYAFGGKHLLTETAGGNGVMVSGSAWIPNVNATEFQPDEVEEFDGLALALTGPSTRSLVINVVFHSTRLCVVGLTMGTDVTHATDTYILHVSFRSKTFVENGDYANVVYTNFKPREGLKRLDVISGLYRQTRGDNCTFDFRNNQHRPQESLVLQHMSEVARIHTLVELRRALECHLDHKIEFLEMDVGNRFPDQPRQSVVAIVKDTMAWKHQPLSCEELESKVDELNTSMRD